MIGKQIQKPVQDWSDYTKTALWCNANKAMIEDKGDWYEVVALPEQTFTEAKAAKLAEINSACDAAIEEKGKEYPVSERLSFDLQLYEATQYKADNTTETPILSVLAEKRGIELTDLVDRVLAKADEVRAYSASAIGQRQALKDQVDAATTIEEVNAIEVNIVI